MAARRVRIPILALVLGAVGALCVVGGILGLGETPPVAVLADPFMAPALLTIGLALLAAEAVLVVLAVLQQRRRRR